MKILVDILIFLTKSEQITSIDLSVNGNFVESHWNNCGLYNLSSISPIFIFDLSTARSSISPQKTMQFGKP